MQRLFGFIAHWKEEVIAEGKREAEKERRESVSGAPRKPGHQRLIRIDSSCFLFPYFKEILIRSERISLSFIFFSFIFISSLSFSTLDYVYITFILERNIVYFKSMKMQLSTRSNKSSV